MARVTTYLFVPRSGFLVMAAIGFCGTPAVCRAQGPRPTPHVVRQVDHVLIVSSKAKELFSLLSETFELPVAWPMSDYGSFASGGVAVGNVNLEVLKSSESVAGAASGEFVGFALEPEPLRTSLPELDARRVSHGSPRPFRSRQPNGTFGTLWTTVALPTVSSETVEVFLCEFGHDLPARRQSLREQLGARDGGPLSVQSVREILYGARDVERMKANWQKLLNPLQPSSQGTWQIGAGPAIRVVQADKDEIQQLIIAVKSLEQARRFLKERNLLGTDQPAAVTMAGSLLQGLNIALVEDRSEGP